MFLQHLLNGIIIGGIYAMMALGYSMVYGVLQIVNWAHADVLMFITADKQVDIDIDTDHPTLLGSISVAEAKEHVAQNQFGEAAMLPKIQASIDFLTQKEGREAIITNLEHAAAAVAGKGGTHIS